MSLEAGKIFEGKVVSIAPFGAFISLPNGKTGLVHISEVALEYVRNISDHLKEGQNVSVKIMNVDDKGKINLSIKKAILEEQKNRQNRPVRPAEFSWNAKSSNMSAMSFEDKLSKFKSDSDERMGDLKRNMESKHGGGYKRSAHAYQ